MDPPQANGESCDGAHVLLGSVRLFFGGLAALARPATTCAESAAGPTLIRLTGGLLYLQPQLPPSTSLVWQKAAMMEGQFSHQLPGPSRTTRPDVARQPSSRPDLESTKVGTAPWHRGSCPAGSLDARSSDRTRPSGHLGHAGEQRSEAWLAGRRDMTWTRVHRAPPRMLPRQTGYGQHGWKSKMRTFTGTHF